MSELFDAVQQLAAKDKLIAELRGENERLNKNLDDLAIETLENNGKLANQIDSLRAQLEEGRANDETKRKAAALMYDLLNKELDTARQEIEQVKAESVRDGNWLDGDGACRVCDGEIPHGHMPNCDIFKMEQEITSLQSDRDKALRVAEEAEKDATFLRTELTKHRDKARGDYWAWMGDGEDHPESLVCPVLMTANQLRAMLSDLSTLRGLVDEMAGELELIALSAIQSNQPKVAEKIDKLLKRHDALKAGREEKK